MDQMVKKNNMFDFEAYKEMARSHKRIDALWVMDDRLEEMITRASIEDLKQMVVLTTYRRPVVVAKMEFDILKRTGATDDIALDGALKAYKQALVNWGMLAA